MTFNEISARVQWNVWGNTIPPANMVAMIEGDEGLIAQAHQSVQEENNFWFMRTWAEITTEYNADTEEFTQAYILPENLKEIINFLWHIEDDDGEYIGFSDPLCFLTEEQSQKHFWPGDNEDSVEYPTHFEYMNGNIVFYPDGNCERTGVLTYWKYVPCLFANGETTLMREAPNTIIALVTSNIYLILHEVELSQVWMGKYAEALEKLDRRDYHRRRAHIHEFGAQDGM